MLRVRFIMRIEAIIRTRVGSHHVESTNQTFESTCVPAIASFVRSRLIDCSLSRSTTKVPSASRNVFSIGAISAGRGARGEG